MSITVPRGQVERLRNIADQLQSRVDLNDARLLPWVAELRAIAAELDAQKDEALELREARTEVAAGATLLARATDRINDLEFALARVTAERDEARAEVGRLRGALESAQAAVWDAHYGEGIALAYARKVDAEIRAALAPSPPDRGKPTDGRCDSCGDACPGHPAFWPGKAGRGLMSWRWAGDHWQHRCAGLIPQAGHPGRANGFPPAYPDRGAEPAGRGEDEHACLTGDCDHWDKADCIRALASERAELEQETRWREERNERDAERVAKLEERVTAAEAERDEAQRDSLHEFTRAEKAISQRDSLEARVAELERAKEDGNG